MMKHSLWIRILALAAALSLCLTGLSLAEGAGDYEVTEKVKITGITVSVETLSAYTVKISWTKSSRASDYSVYYAPAASGPYVTIKAHTTDTSFVFTDSRINGTVGYIGVRAHKYRNKTHADDSDMVIRSCKGLAKPVISTATVNGSNQVTVTWGAVPNANDYFVFSSTNGSTGWTQVGQYTGTSATFPGGSALLYYKVRAHASSGHYGPMSDGVRAQLQDASLGTPAAPTATVLDAGKGVKLTWAPVADATGYYVYRYNKSTNATTYIGVAGTELESGKCVYTDTKAPMGVQIAYKLKAIRSIGGTSMISQGAVSARSAYVTVPEYADIPAPTRTEAWYVDKKTVCLKWTASKGAVGYDIMRGSVLVTSTAETNYYDELPTDFAVYDYTIKPYIVKMVSNVETKVYGPVLKITPSMKAPTLKSVESDQSAGKLTLTWSYPEEYAESVQAFEIWRSNIEGYGYTKIATVSGTGDALYTYDDASFKKGQGNYYKLLAVRGTRKSGWSETLSCFALGQVIPVKAEPEGVNSVKVTWASQPGATGYYVYRHETATGFTYRGYTSTTSYVDSGLITGKDYYYRVRPRRAEGTTVYMGSIGDARPFIFLSAPVLRYTIDGTDKVTIKWNAVPAVGHSDVKYRVKGWSEDGVSFNASADVTACEYQFTSIPAAALSQVLHFTVQAYVPVDGSTYPNYMSEIGGKVSAETALYLLAAPSVDDIRPSGFDAATLIWTASVALEDADGYAIYRSTAETGVYTLVAEVENSMSFTDMDLLPGKYWYKIRAYKIIDDIKYYTNYTTPKSVTILDQGCIIGGYGTADQQGVVIGWNKVANAKGYYIYRAKTVDGTFTKIQQIDDVNTVTFIDGKQGGTSPLAANTTYYYKVVPYQVINNGRVSGPESEVQAVTTLAWPDLTQLESTHPYKANSEKSYNIYLTGANYLAITFDSRTYTEKGADFIRILDSADTLVGEYSGSSLAGQTIIVAGEQATIILSADDSAEEWGFAVTSVEPLLTISDRGRRIN